MEQVCDRAGLSARFSANHRRVSRDKTSKYNLQPYLPVVDAMAAGLCFKSIPFI